ncbi:MAG: hypothetical protein BECKG1743E_GA0114224_101356, partial [Candidatus Kentron sp. G]
LLLHNILRLIVFILLPIWEIIIRLPCGLWFYLQKSHNKPGGPAFSPACSCHYAGGNVALLLLI